MSSGTPPEKNSDSSSNKSAQPTQQLENINQLWTALVSFAEQLAQLIVEKNWVSLLLLIDAVLVLFLNPGVLKTFRIEYPNQYPVFFGVAVGTIFLTALGIAIRTILRKPPPLPDFTERKAIKGLRAFSKDDAEIFAQLQRDRDLRECLESITSDNFRLGILMGESGSGKTSFLQAGIIPQLAKVESKERGVYIRFSNREPLETICQELVDELQLPEAEVNNRDWLQVLSLAVETTDKPLVLIFDQFEQFFVHCKQKFQREPFINALKNWYCDPNLLPVKILISIRGDLADRLIELQKALGYSLSPQEVFRLERFSPEEATKILQVIARAEELRFDESFVRQLTAEELASREDGLISPVDLQVLAWTIEAQNTQELKAFNQTAFQKIGGIEGLMTRFLNKTLDARVTSIQRQAAIQVLLAMTDLERNVRAGVLTVEKLQDKLQGTVQPNEIEEATNWLACGGVRLITPVQRDSNRGYELAHERLIPALREVAGKELTTVDRANQLLDRRVNEWLGNKLNPRYLFNWQELRLIQQQKPYLVWGANERNKKRLLQRSWTKLYRQLVALGMALVFILVGMGWWHSPWGQIQQVRWKLERLSTEVDNEDRQQAALAFIKDEDLEQARAIADSIQDSSSYKAKILRAIAESISKLENPTEAEKYLQRTLTVAEQIQDSSHKAWVLKAIAESSIKLKNTTEAGKTLQRALTVAEQIQPLSVQAKVLPAITQSQAKLDRWRQAHNTVNLCPTDECKVESLAHILTAWAEKKNPALKELASNE